MENNENEPIDDLRGKTDKSLEGERNKTDDYLEQKSEGIEDKASETIRLNRLAADKDRDSKRAEVDQDKVEQRSDSINFEPTIVVALAWVFSFRNGLLRPIRDVFGLSLKLAKEARSALHCR